MILVENRAQFDAALKVLARARIIAVDTETTGFHVHMGHRLCGISTYCVLPDDENYAVAFYFPFRHDINEKQINLFTNSENLPVEWIPEFQALFNRPDVTLIFHHAKFDLKMLRADGFWIQPGSVKAIYDTMVMAQMVDENSSHKLDDLAKMYGLDKGTDYKKRFKDIVRKAGGYHRTTPAEMASYACDDAQNTYELAGFLGQALVDQDLMRLWPREMQFQFVLLEMEWAGISLDVPLAQKRALEATRRMRELEDELGFDPGKAATLARILHASPEAGGLGLPWTEASNTPSAEFPDGMPVMDERALVMLKNHVADTVLEYRGLVKANSTWYTGWQQKMGPDQRIHPSYNANPDSNKKRYGTVTTRLSSSFPNIQQMPRDDEVGVKLLLKPDPGMVMVEFDYAQIEYREAACYAEDPILIDDFRNNVDTHTQLGLAIGIDRQSAKQAAYTILYGGAGPTLARNMEKQVWLNERQIIEFPDEKGIEIINAYYKRHPNMRKVSKLAEYNAQKHGYVQLWTGRKRHFPSDRPWDFRKAFNSVLQGGAAEIIKTSMLKFYQMRDIEPFRMLIQVHDSLWFMVPEDNFERHCLVIKETMEWPTQHFPVPFPVDYKVIRRHELEAA
jgi:DNA polymerase-1